MKVLQLSPELLADLDALNTELAKIARIDDMVFRSIYGLPMSTQPPCPDCGQTVGHYDDCPVGMGVIPSKEPDVPRP